MKNFITGLTIFSGILLLQAGCLTESVGNLVESTGNLVEGVGDLVESAVGLVKSASDLVESVNDQEKSVDVPEKNTDEQVESVGALVESAGDLVKSAVDLVESAGDLLEIKYGQMEDKVISLVWRDWMEENWRKLTPEQVDEFFPTPEAMNETDKWGVNPLLSASAYSSKAAINRFIENGAKINKEFDGWTTLGSAIIAENTNIVSVLIEHGVDINQRFNGGWVPLVAGIARGNTDGIAKLLAAGADLDVLQEFDFLKAVNIPLNSADYHPTAESLVGAWEESDKSIELRLISEIN